MPVLGRVPAQRDRFARLHVPEEFAQHVPLLRHAGIQPHHRGPGGGGDVAGMMIVSPAPLVVGLGAYQQALLRPRPVAGVHVPVNFQRRGEFQIRQVRHDLQVRPGLPHRLVDGPVRRDGVVLRGHGPGQVPVMRAEGAVIEHHAVQFLRILRQQLVAGRPFIVRAGAETRGVRPSECPLLRTGFDQQDPRLLAVHPALQGGEGDLLVLREILHRDRVQRLRRGRKGRHRLPLRPGQALRDILHPRIRHVAAFRLLFRRQGNRP